MAADPCSLVIFGASGDLTRRKLMPALYNLSLDGLLPEHFAVVGAARSEMTTDRFRDELRQGVDSHSRRPLDDEAWRGVVEGISYACIGGEQGYRRLADHLRSIEGERETVGNRLFYLATPPSAFPGIVRGLESSGLDRPQTNGTWSRVVLEKPIGHDLDSARELNREVNRAFPEDAVYRIDHYLGKETVQNLLVFRFANAIFEPLWNQKYVDHVQITVAESLGVEGRGKYYEEAGTSRDMLQNHMFQLLCLIAMEPPASLRADAIRDEKVKVLHALRALKDEDAPEATVRAQYSPGVVDGKQVPGYTEEEGVAAESRTETYVAARMFIDNWRWGGVPFYLRAGKRMPSRVTEVALQFRDVPHELFGREQHEQLVPNVLAMRIQPDEGITLQFDAKVPGTVPRIRPVTMDFGYGDSFGQPPPEAYERLLLDAILGDTTLFLRRDEVESAWAWVDRLHGAWAADGSPLPGYAAGTWGPAEADVMMARDGRKWRRP